jgi:hypothetical protein
MKKDLAIFLQNESEYNELLGLLEIKGYHWYHWYHCPENTRGLHHQIEYYDNMYICINWQHKTIAHGINVYLMKNYVVIISYDEYIKGTKLINIVVTSEIQLKTLMLRLESEGYRWCSGHKPTEWGRWKDWHSRTDEIVISLDPFKKISAGLSNEPDGYHSFISYEEYMLPKQNLNKQLIDSIKRMISNDY